MPSGDDDITPAKTPTMIAARQISQLDQYRYAVEVEWEDNEDRDDELVTIFHYRPVPPGGSGSVYVDTPNSGYTAAGTGRCTGTIVMSAGDFQVSAVCSRQVHLSDVNGEPSQVSISSEESNAVPCTVGAGQTPEPAPEKPGKGPPPGKGPNK